MCTSQLSLNPFLADARSKAATIAHSEAVRVASLEARTVAAVEASQENVLHTHPEHAHGLPMLGADVATVQRFTTSANKDGITKTSSTTVYDTRQGEGVTVTTSKTEQPTHEEASEAGGQALSKRTGSGQVSTSSRCVIPRGTREERNPSQAYSHRHNAQLSQGSQRY